MITNNLRLNNNNNNKLYIAPFVRNAYLYENISISLFITFTLLVRNNWTNETNVVNLNNVL